MKIFITLIFFLFFSFARVSKKLNPKDIEKILTNLKGNANNIYLLLFLDPSSQDEIIKNENKKAEDGVRSILSANPFIVYSKIDVADPKFSTIKNTAGVTSAPVVLMIKDGRGKWLSEESLNSTISNHRNLLLFFEQEEYHEYYQIPYYYGSKYLRRSSKYVVVNDSPSKIKWSHVFGVDYSGNLWVADKTNHVVKFISKDIGAIYIVAGTYGTSGYRDGNVVKSSFNSPSSLYIWRSSTYDKIRAKNTKAVLFSNAGAANFDCKFATKLNYTSCGGVIVTSDASNSDDIDLDTDGLNTDNLKFIDFSTDQDFLGITDTIGTTYVYIADTGNHWIRRISLVSYNVETVAGVWGTSGFLDGPLGDNLFKSPELVSVDDLGYVFVFDDGNNYVRMIDLTGTVYTLYQGAWDIAENEYPPIIPFDVKLKTLIWYKSWIKTFGEPSEHYFSSENVDNYWFDYWLYWPRENHPLYKYY